MKTRVLMLGAPGTGKGTHSENLARRLGVPCISTGHMLREAVTAGSDIGRQAKEYTDKGLLVPDKVMITLVNERLSGDDCRDGCVLDGFPRTIAQAEALDAIFNIDVVLSLELSDSEIERRMTGRRICEACGATYHIEHYPPRCDGQCDSCGGCLTRRADDEPETVRVRLVAYHESTEPLKGYYERAGKLICISSRGSIEQTSMRCMEALGLT